MSQSVNDCNNLGGLLKDVYHEAPKKATKKKRIFKVLSKV